MLPEQHRLTSGRDFKTIFARGKTFTHRLVVLKLLARKGEEPARFGFVTSSSLGKAVSRNRAKRRLREAVRLLGDRVYLRGYDAVLIARPSVRESEFSEITRAVEELFLKAGIVRECQSE